MYTYAIINKNKIVGYLRTEDAKKAIRKFEETKTDGILALVLPTQDESDVENHLLNHHNTGIF